MSLLRVMPLKKILMNGVKEVLLAEYNEESKFFDKIYEVYDINYAPYILKSFYKEDEINDTPFRTNYPNGLEVEVFRHGEIDWIYYYIV